MYHGKRTRNGLPAFIIDGTTSQPPEKSQISYYVFIHDQPYDKPIHSINQVQVETNPSRRIMNKLLLRLIFGPTGLWKPPAGLCTGKPTN